jgi:phage-related minor tail protein
MGGGGIEGITMGTFGGTRAKGGPVSSGQTYMVGERGPELFVPGRSGSIVPNGAMGGDVNVVVNVDAKGSSVEGDQSQAKALGNAISAAVQSELVKQKRPGGLLA